MNKEIKEIVNKLGLPVSTIVIEQNVLSDGCKHQTIKAGKYEE